MKKFVALLLALVLTLTVASFAAAEKYPEVTFCLIQFDPYPSDEGLAQVEAAINAITEPRIGVHVNVECWDVAEYQSNIAMRHLSNEPCDIFVEAVPDSVAAGRAADLTDLIAVNAPEALASIGEDVLAACKVNGRIYGLPHNKRIGIGTQLQYRKDLTDAAGITLGERTSLEELSDVFAKLKAQYPDIYPVHIPGNYHVILLYNMKNYDLDLLSETTAFNVSGAALLGEESQKNLKVVSMYESQEWKDMLALIRDWYLKGYISPDATTSIDDNFTALKSGRFATCMYTAVLDFGVQLTDFTGYPIGVTTLSDYTFDTSHYISVDWVVSSQCKDPAAATRFLNLLYTDSEINNLVVWGVQGTDYVLTENNQVRYPDGLDANSVPYTCSVAAAYAGTYGLCYEFNGTDPTIRERLLAMNEQNRLSNALGFNVDLSVISNELNACTAVVDEYMPGFLTGALDLDEVYDTFISALYSNGLQKIIDTKQQMLDDWAISNGKK